jgi:hypothetical protein
MIFLKKLKGIKNIETQIKQFSRPASSSINLNGEYEIYEESSF